MQYAQSLNVRIFELQTICVLFKSLKNYLKKFNLILKKLPLNKKPMVSAGLTKQNQPKQRKKSQQSPSHDCKLHPQLHSNNRKNKKKTIPGAFNQPLLGCHQPKQPQIITIRTNYPKNIIKTLFHILISTVIFNNP